MERLLGTETVPKFLPPFWHFDLTFDTHRMYDTKNVVSENGSLSIITLPIMAEQKYCIKFDDVKDAASRIQGVAHRTPVLTSETIIPATGKKYFFKVEAMQKTGSFKFRGALNAVKTHLESSPSRTSMHVVTHSSGVRAQLSLVIHKRKFQLVSLTFFSESCTGFGVGRQIGFNRIPASIGHHCDALECAIGEETGRRIVWGNYCGSREYQ
jgi:hypothetical protein